MGKQDLSNNLLKTTFSKQESTITLKVLIHCEGCKRKVKRIIKCVDGVNSVNIEADIGKVTVVGSGVDSREILNSLNKAGKHAEIWQFGGGKQLPSMNQAAAATTLKNNQHNNNAEKNKMALQENKNKSTDQGKGKVSTDMTLHGGGNVGFGGGKGKGGGDMIELASVNPSFMMPPPKPLPFPNGGGLTYGGSFEKPMLPTNNVAILSKSVAPRPTVYHGESSFNPHENSEYASAEYATHMFSDENANNCSVM